MLGLNFHIFCMRFATHLDIKLFSEKTKKDFQGRVIKKPDPRNILLGGVVGRRVTPPPALSNNSQFS